MLVKNNKYISDFKLYALFPFFFLKTVGGVNIVCVLSDNII